jgi:periplasmic divalent cation tolerance protein
MNSSIVVFCTCGSEEEGHRLAEALVQSKLAACVNILGGIQSIYRWQGNVGTSREALLLIKSTTECFDELRARITELHSYDMPEIIALPITAGSEKYLDWISQETGGALRHGE